MSAENVESSVHTALVAVTKMLKCSRVSGRSSGNLKLVIDNATGEARLATLSPRIIRSWLCHKDLRRIAI